MAKSGLQIVSHGRTAPLTNAETVRLGRRLHKLLGVSHVSYPAETPTVVVEVWDFHGSLPAEAMSAIEALIGTFDVSHVEG
jgi:hypothetical protein